VLQPIHGFRVRRVGDPEARSHAKRSDGPDGPDEPISYGIRRCEFDHFLLERAEARLRLGEPLGSLERRGGRWRVNGALETPVVVGAGGHFCPVARRLGAAGGDAEPIIAAQELEFELPAAERDACPIEPEVPEIFFTADLKGYGWVFRKGHYLNVGLGRQDRGQLSGHFERFLAFLRDEGRLPGGLPRRPRWGVTPPASPTRAAARASARPSSRGCWRRASSPALPPSTPPPWRPTRRRCKRASAPVRSACGSV
jgi:flavin-dependent dehydrogenase